MKHKVGTLVRIIDDINDHQLPIGSTHIIEEIGEFIGDEFYTIENMAVTDAECESVKVYLTYRLYDGGGAVVCITETVEESIEILCANEHRYQYVREDYYDFSEIIFDVEHGLRKRYTVQQVDKNASLMIEFGGGM